MAVSLGNVLEFVVSVIIVKGVLVHWVIERADRSLHKWFATTPRKQGIYTHYISQAKQEGHAPDDVYDCPDGQCGTLFV